jgi:hypothetical protein
VSEPSPIRREPVRKRDAHVRFKEAVLALSDEPTALNLLNYLKASRELDAALPRIRSNTAA